MYCHHSCLPLTCVSSRGFKVTGAQARFNQMCVCIHECTSLVPWVPSYTLYYLHRWQWTIFPDHIACIVMHGFLPPKTSLEWRHPYLSNHPNFSDAKIKRLWQRKTIQFMSNTRFWSFFRCLRIFRDTNINNNRLCVSLWGFGPCTSWAR